MKENKLHLTVTNQIDNQGIIFLTNSEGDMFSMINLAYDNKTRWGFSQIKQGVHNVIDPQNIGSITFPPDSDGVVKEFLTT
jgi:hypothetical protein